MQSFTFKVANDTHTIKANDWKDAMTQCNRQILDKMQPQLGSGAWMDYDNNTRFVWQGGNFFD